MSAALRRTLTIPEAAEQLGIGVRLAYRLAASGQIPAKRLGSRWVIPVLAFETYLQGGSPTTVDGATA